MSCTLDITALLWQSALYCLLVTVAMVPVGLKNPRIMLHSYPKDIQAAVPPLTGTERKQRLFFATPILLAMIGYPALIALTYVPAGVRDFYSLFTVTWGMMLIFNVYDLLVLDWLLFCTIQPNFMIVPGTKGHPGYRNYMFHFIGFIKGIFITLILSAALAGLLALI